MGTGETVSISRLVSIFAGCICIKYQNLNASLSKTIFINCTKRFFFIIITVLLTVERAYRGFNKIFCKRPYTSLRRSDFKLLYRF